MKKQLLFVTILFLSAHLAFAQYAGQVATNMSSGGAAQGATAGAIATLLGPIKEANTKRTFNPEEFQGSPYTNNSFLPTRVFYKDEDMGPLYYRYNAFNGEIEVKESPAEEGIRALGRDKNIAILNGKYPMSFKTFIDRNNNTLNGYLTQLVDGEEFDLYRRIRVKYTEGQKAANSFVKAVPSRFSQFTEYYVQKKGVNRIDEFVGNNRSLYQLVGSQGKNDLKSFLKENDLNPKEEQDLIRIFQYLNE